ncbi:MAG: response regulator transcription factor [Clostridia bacterium]|nr:response regulator transcription factor [Clostridia bacterium]
MLEIAVVEDNDQEAKVLNDCLNRYAQEHQRSFAIHRYPDGDAFLADERSVFDLVFMDVEMPLVNGLRTAEKLRERDSQVTLVFVTKLFQYAVNGYEYDAADYIIKPIRYASFSLKMERILKRCKRPEETFIQLKYSGGIKRLPLIALGYAELQGHRIIYHTDDGDLVYYGSGKQVEETLPQEEFFRCNSGYFVNLRRVTGLNGYTVSLGETELQVSHSRRKAFVEALHTYLARNRS